MGMGGGYKVGEEESWIVTPTKLHGLRERGQFSHFFSYRLIFLAIWASSCISLWASPCILVSLNRVAESSGLYIIQLPWPERDSPIPGDLMEI